MTITATQILEMLAKAQKLGIHYDVYDSEEHGHFIQFEVDWFSDEYESYSYEKVFSNLTNESYGFDGWDFLTWMNMLDEKLEEKRQEKIKEQKRQELLARLTDFEKELLGVK
jgi:hypothetical protein